MPQSLSLVIAHFIFSTKSRQPFLTKDIREALFPYLATIARKGDGECYRVGGVEDHVHLAVRLGRQVTIADMVQELKVSSTHMLKREWPELLKGFAWQKGYGAFSVGPSDLPALLEYIDRQEEHHKKRSFKEELLAFLHKYGVKYDEQYLWD